MMSMQRQCNEAVELLAALQACFGRDGWPIPCRAEDLKVYLERMRNLVGVPNTQRRG